MIIEVDLDNCGDEFVYRRAIADFEKKLFGYYWEKCKRNQAYMVDVLGISRVTLKKKLDRYGIQDTEDGNGVVYRVKVSEVWGNKLCKMCFKEKNKSEFTKNSNTNDGYAVYCKVCYNKKYTNRGR